MTTCLYHGKYWNLLINQKKTVLLFGPGETGKSTLMRSLRPELDINLACETEHIKFIRNPAELEQRLAVYKPKSVLIDEVQRLPSLLNTIQAIIDEDKNAPRFLLTGSSARKLRRGQANLLKVLLTLMVIHIAVLLFIPVWKKRRSTTSKYFLGRI